MTHKIKLSLSLFLLFLSHSAYANNGYFSIGYGAKMMGMAGAAIAFPQDTLAGAVNPAGMSQFEGLDIGARLLYLPRDGEFDCRGIGACDELVRDDSRRDSWLIPNFGWNTRLSDKSTLGVTVYGNGGINTTYRKRLFTETAERVLGAPSITTDGHLGVDFAQVIIATTYTYEMSPNNYIGVSPLFGIQKFSAQGLDFFEGVSSDPGSLTNRGDELSYGLGIKVGWFYKPNDTYQFGAYYAPKMQMTKMKKYSGLFANNGDFDIPSSYGVGMAINFTDQLAVAFDVMRINYKDIDSLSNPVPSVSEFTGGFSADRLLGAKDGVGFGWRSITAYKLGVRYLVNDTVTLRMGANFGEEQIPRRSGLLNPISPAMPSKHLTAGFSYKSSQHSEWSFAVMHAFRNELTATDTAFFGADVKFGIEETTLDVSYTYSY
jgi:long-chain fatty acid transport protein